MSLAIPLSVRLVTSQADRHVTAEVSDLAFRSAVPGGFASCTVSLHRPLTVRPTEVDYYGQLIVYDTRTGRVAWEGRLEDPGRSAGSDGQVWDLTAIGPAGHTRDRMVPLVYVDRQMSDPAWQRADILASMAKSDIALGGGSSNVPTLRLQWSPGQTVDAGDVVTVRYSRLRDTGQWVAYLAATHVEGAASTVLKVEAVSRHFVLTGTDTTLESDNWATTSATLLQRYGVEHTDKFDGADLRLRQSSSSTSNDNYWTNMTGVVVVGSRYAADGSEVTSGYTDTVVASDVVADLLGRLLPQYDGAAATIDATTHAIDQLAYVDGADAAKIIDDLMRLEPGYWWAAWERTADDKYQFEWRSWPTEVRYEADVRDGYSSTGSADGLYNAVGVRWRDATGQIRTTRRTQDVPELTRAGITREKMLDLGDEAGSSGNAAAAGDAWLAEHASPPNAGRLTVARPIMDMAAGRMVQPWEIRPGALIRLRGVMPHADGLNATDRNGTTVMRLVEVEYRASDAAATLHLDSVAPSATRALAHAMAQPRTHRRR